MGEKLQFSVQTIYSSPLQRAQQTATAIGPNPIIVDDLAELDQGHLEGLTAQDAMDRFPDFFPQWVADPENARVPAGETLGECRDRALNALHNIVAAHTNNDTIIIVSHQLVLASILCTLSQHPLTEWRAFRFKNLGAALLWATPSRLEIQALRWKP